jgi:DMSO reductase family type II enzyme chaperone
MYEAHDHDRDVDRARLYSALSLAFDRPGDRLLTAIDEDTFVESMPAAAIDEPVADAADALADATPEDGSELHPSYADAFGDENESTVSQYEAAYAPGTLVTNTDRLADINGFYRAFGLDVAADRRDRADYLPTQLEFAGHLALQRAYLADEGDDEGVEVVTDARASFVEDHLGRWVPRFVEEVREEVDEPFYRALADLLDALVEDEARTLGADPDVFEAEPTAPLESLPGMERDDEGRLATSCGAMNPSPGADPGAPRGGDR